MSRLKFVLIILLISLYPLFSLDIKLATLAPEGTPWAKAIKELAKEWYELSDGKIRMKYYMNGVAGSEEGMIRKMQGARSSLQAAALTSVGMNKISPEVLALSIPMLVRNDEEMEWLIKRMGPLLDDRILEKGFKVIAWVPAGWVNVFSKSKVTKPEDLKNLKLAVEVKEEFIQGWKRAGFHAVPVHTVDTMAALQSGMIEAFYAPPLVAASFQWFGIAQNMCSLRLAPMLGGFVIPVNTWEKIPEDLRPKLIESANRILGPIYPEVQELEKEAINIMLENGLTINTITKEEEKIWEKEVYKSYDAFIGTAFPEEIYKLIEENLSEYRSGKKN